MENLFKKSDKTESFWRAFKESNNIPDTTQYDVVAFGDSPEMANELAELVQFGIKRATTCLYRDIIHSIESAPVIGGHVVLVDGYGTPKAIWQTIELRLGPMDSVTEEFAYLEGEGDGSREDWLEMHHRYFSRQAKLQDWQMHEKIEVVFEVFEVVFPM
jgi:uncharacterized protein YhfF